MGSDRGDLPGHPEPRGCHGHHRGAAGGAAYTNQFAEAANAALQAEGVDTTGDGFTPIEVALNEGGA